MDQFVFKVLLSLLIGIVWVIVSTNIAERVSGKLGGLIMGLPSTAVISLLFVGLTQGTPAALTSSMIVPYSSGLYCFFFITFFLLTKKGFKIGFISSLIVWFVFAFVAAKFPPNNIFESIIVGLTLITLAIFWSVKKIHIDHKLIPKKIISGPLWLIAGPRWGGIFATFPALTISSMLITIRSGGVEFTRLIAKNVLISTTTTISIYAILSYFLFPIVGVILGTILSYIALLVISIPLYFMFLKR